MTELGTSTLGSELLGANVVTVGMGVSTSTIESTSTLTPTSKVSPSMGDASPSLLDQGIFTPTILDPKNIKVQYDKSREMFVSEWIPTDTFNDERDQLVTVLSLDDDADSVSVVIERDLTGDGSADIHSNVLEVDSTTQLARADPTGEPGEYRLVFPFYNQLDVIRRLNVAITYDNTERLINNIPYEFLRNDIRGENLDGSDDISPLVESLGDALDRIDASIDAVYDNRFSESARGVSLNKLGKPVGIQRRDIGNTERADDLESDARLRKRVSAARALIGLDTTAPSFTQFLSLLFPDGVTGISITVVSNEPVVEVTIPTNVVDRHPLNQSEIQNILKRAVTSSYNVSVVVDGTFDFTSQTASDDEWNDGIYTK